MGYPLTGGSFLQVASEEAHLVLLPAANTVFTQENAALSAASGQATELPTVLAALVLAVVTGLRLVPGAALADQAHQPRAQPRARPRVAAARHQRDLARGRASSRPARTWTGGIGHGSGPVQDLALASIGVQQIRGDAVLNVISRSGSTSFPDDFAATSKKVGPGPGSWLGDAAAAQQAGGPGAALVAAAERDATAWYAANTQVYQLGTAANYAAERNLVVGGGPAARPPGTPPGGRPHPGDRRRPGRLRVRRHRRRATRSTRWKGS